MAETGSGDICEPNEMFGLSGRTALVTGAGGHLGGAMVRALAGAGARIYLAGRSLAPLEALAAELGPQAQVLRMDVTDAASVDAGLARIFTETGCLDVLVNNAHSGKTGTLESARAEDYTNAFAVSVQSMAELVRKALPLMRQAVSGSGQASVINISSMYGMVSPDPSIYGDSGHNSPPYYGAAKAAILQYTRYAAVHLAEEKIRVNAISPGPFPKAKVAQTMPGLWDTLNRKSPMKRVGQPQEIGGAAVFLASDAASYVTGINLPVDGGWTAW